MHRMKRNYLISAIIVWIAIIAATVFVLRGTTYFAQMLSVLGGGAVWFVVIVPGAIFRESRQTETERKDRSG